MEKFTITTNSSHPDWVLMCRLTKAHFSNTSGSTAKSDLSSPALDVCLLSHVTIIGVALFKWFWQATAPNIDFSQ